MNRLLDPSGHDDVVGAGPATFIGRASKARPRVAIRVMRRFSASPKRVFEAWLDPEQASKWLFATASRPMTHVAIDARVGGSFCFTHRRDGESVRHIGKYIEIVPDRRLVFALVEQTRMATRVIVEIAPLKRGCELSVSHENLHPDRADHTEARWTGILYGLGVTLASRSSLSNSRSAKRLLSVVSHSTRIRRKP